MEKLQEKFRQISSRQLLTALVIIIICLAGWMILQGQQKQNNVAETPLPAAQVSIVDDSRSVMVLNYHKIVNEHKSLSVPPADFEKHLKWLQEYGYTSITPEQLYAFVVDGAELPEKPVLITFDDGYRDNYTNAYPLLKKYGFKATIFVVTSFMGTYKNYLTWDMAKEMSENGISIESHTYSHKSMTETSDEDITKELTKSREAIKNKLGIDADFVAYPTGTYNLHIADLVKNAGYKGAFTIKYDNVSRASNVYALERVPIFHTENTNKDFLERIQYLPLIYKYGWVKN